MKVPKTQPLRDAEGARQPLLQPAAGPLHVKDGVNQAHEWDGRLLDCCGRCDAPGLQSCALVYFCGCLPFG